jgi:hypothetical protein
MFRFSARTARTARRAGLLLAMSAALAAPTSAAAAAPQPDAKLRDASMLSRVAPAADKRADVSRKQQRAATKRAARLVRSHGSDTFKASKKQSRSHADGCVWFSDGAICAIGIGYDAYDEVMYLWAQDAYGRFLGEDLIYASDWIGFLYSLGF